MNRIGFLMSGYVKVCFRGAQLPRFFLLCKNKGIEIFHLQYIEPETYTGQLSIEDFFRLKEIRSKVKVKISVRKKCGRPFWIQRLLRKKGLLIFILFVCMFLGYMNSKIWNIEMTGNQTYTNEEILKFLKHEGISHGASKKQIQCVAIAESLRRNFGNFSWVSAKLHGTKLTLEFREGTYLQETDKSVVPCDLVATESGRIELLAVRAGTPVKKAGDLVEKGEILVKGITERRDDSQEMTEEIAVSADADVLIARKIPYYSQFSMSYRKKIYDKEKIKGFFIQMGVFAAFHAPKPHTKQEITISVYRLCPNENFKLPVFWGSYVEHTYAEQICTYTKKEATSKAKLMLRNYQKKLLEKGIQICENDVKIRVNGKTCTSSGYMLIKERAVAVHPVKVEERTAEDGQQYY